MGAEEDQCFVGGAPVVVGQVLAAAAVDGGAPWAPHPSFHRPYRQVLAAHFATAECFAAQISFPAFSPSTVSASAAPLAAVAAADDDAKRGRAVAVHHSIHRLLLLLHANGAVVGDSAAAAVATLAYRRVSAAYQSHSLLTVMHSQ